MHEAHGERLPDRAGHGSPLVVGTGTAIGPLEQRPRAEEVVLNLEDAVAIVDAADLHVLARVNVDDAHATNLPRGGGLWKCSPLRMARAVAFDITAGHCHPTAIMLHWFKVWVATLICPLANRLAWWAMSTRDAETVRVALAAFPTGTRVRLHANGCCRACEEPGNLEREWTVDRYDVDAGDYSLTAMHCEVGRFPERVYVHASAMRRA